MHITKLDAARRQLLAAIHVQWFLLEPLAAYQLASNAAEISDALLKRSGRLRIKEQIQNVHGLTPKQASALINTARNFAKHADTDPDGTIDDLTFADVDAVILTACIDYPMAAGRSHQIMGLFIAWYAAINPQQMGDMFYEPAAQLFPNLAGKERALQVEEARRVYRRVSQTPLLHDRRADLTDNWRWSSLRDLGQALRLPAAGD